MSEPYPIMVTADSVDPRFNDPYIDVDEWRDAPAPATNVFGQIVPLSDEWADQSLRHRYVHGGFKGTDAKFVFAFPPKEHYEGRFFQATHQLLTSEDPLPQNIAFALASGGYAVQTNMGGSENPRMAEQSCSPEFDKTIRGYRVNAEAAKYSRIVAAEMYGEHRTHGYLFGGSGGSHQTITSAEVTTGVWDGYLPYVAGNNQSIPNMFTVRVNAIRVLMDKWPQIMDAIEPGGSGDPYAGLNDEQRQALEEAHRSGFPPRAWFNYVPVGGGPLRLVANYVPLVDPAYLDDFWTKPGYLGTDPNSSVRDARVQHPTSVTAVIDATPVRLKLASVPGGDLTGADVIVSSGAAAGQDCMLGGVDGDTISFGYGTDPKAVENIKAGDELRIDNSRFLALQTYHRHQYPPSNPDYDYPEVHDYYRNPDGTPKYPQRGVDVGAKGGEHSSGHLQTGHFRDKMIVVECLLDGDALPWQADWYRREAEKAAGRSIDDKYRLWYIDNAQHTDPQTDLQRTHVVGYAQSSLQYALRELAAWVEEGVEPPPSTDYSVKQGQVLVPTTAAERRGIQPVVHLRVNDGVRADVAVGETVTLRARIDVPPGAGKIVGASWDFEGLGTYPDDADLGDTSNGTVEISAKHSFSKPGTYFPALRVASQRESNPDTPFARSLNLGRVRVVVS